MKKNKKFYLVLFEWEDTKEVEGLFTTLKDAKNYIFNASMERGLHVPEEIWIKEIKITRDVKKMPQDQISKVLEQWGCEDKTSKKEFLEDITIEVKHLKPEK